MNLIQKFSKIYSAILLVSILLFACKEEEVFENPYAGGKEALAISFSNGIAPVPAEGAPGSVITFEAPGAVVYKDQLTFSFNGETAEIVEFTGSKVKVKVPERAASGATSITIGDQVVFGPQFKVLGKITFDPFFGGKRGADRWVNDYLRLKDGRFLLVGGFTNYDERGALIPNNGIVLTTKTGAFDASFRLGTGAEGFEVSSIAASPNDANFFIGGQFQNFNSKGLINNITRLQSNGALDEVQVDAYSTPFTAQKRTVPAFNGGTDGEINRVFYFNNKIIAVGNFSYYLSRRYNTGRTVIRNGTTTYEDFILRDSIEAKQLIRFDAANGAIDKTYHFNTSTNKGLEGGNGSLRDAIMQPDGKLIIVGTFTTFDNVAAGRIVRLNTDGTIDNTFNVGVGANANIYSVNYNAATNKIVIAGIFGSFNGKATQGLALLNLDGSVDNSLAVKNFDNGFPFFAQQLSDGLIVVSGSFRKYDGVKKPGFIILSPNGNLAPGYNATGDFAGNIYRVIESTNEENKRSLMLLGSFTRFDATPVKNITAIVLEN